MRRGGARSLAVAIVLNNARFIGNAGFRQNEQTFDAVRLEARPMPHLALTYLYLDDVHRTLGDTIVLKANGTAIACRRSRFGRAYGKLSGYALLLDFSNAASQSSETYGARWQKAWDIGAYNARLTLEAAQQADYGNAPTRFDLGYQSAELVVRRGDWSGTLGGERLEGNGVRGFSTPLATSHAYSKAGRSVRQHAAGRCARPLCRRLL